MSPAQRRLRGTARGFVIGALAGFTVWFALLYADLADPNVEAMYETTRPHGLLAMLHFREGYEILFLMTGSVGALVGLATSGSAPIRRLVAIPVLALVGSILLASAWLNLPNIDAHPYSVFVTIALA